MQNSYDILLVEDNALDADLAIRVLRKRDLAGSVFHAKDGQEALDFLFGTPARQPAIVFPVKLVLLDLKMPKIGGLEVLRRMKSSEQTRLVPVVVLTSSEEPGDVLESYKLGANSYIVKPVDFAAFNEVVGGVAEYWLRWNTLPRFSSTRT
jgi:two-component system, response regulator